MKNQIDEQMSLSIIMEAIENSKSRLKENGFFYLLWGWLVLAGSLLQFGLIRFSSTPYNWIGWPVFMFSGAIISAIYGYRLGKRSNVRTFIDQAMIYLWYGFMIVLFIIMVMGSVNHLSFTIINPLIITLYGLGTFVSGGLLKFKPLILGGIAAWVCAILAFLVHSEYQLLIMAAAIIIAYLVPGYILKSRSNGHV